MTALPTVSQRCHCKGGAKGTSRSPLFTLCLHQQEHLPLAVTAPRGKTVIIKSDFYTPCDAVSLTMLCAKSCGVGWQENEICCFPEGPGKGDLPGGTAALWLLLQKTLPSRLPSVRKQAVGDGGQSVALGGPSSPHPASARVIWGAELALAFCLSFPV